MCLKRGIQENRVPGDTIWDILYNSRLQNEQEGKTYETGIGGRKIPRRRCWILSKTICLYYETCSILLSTTYYWRGTSAHATNLHIYVFKMQYFGK